jgi:hypothetical protein
MYADPRLPARAGRSAATTRRSQAPLAVGLLGAALLALAGCEAGSRGPTTPAVQGGVRLAVAANVTAAPGAVIHARALFRPGATGAAVTLGQDSATIGAGTTELRLRVTVDACLRDADARGTTCVIDLDVRLRRDGRELDQTIVPVSVRDASVGVAEVSVSLFEVASVQIETTASGSLEPGDTRTFTAVPFDRSGAVVPARAPVWSVVAGGITLLEPGRIRADTPGPAELRVVVGGLTRTITLSVDPASVATLALSPADTTVLTGDEFAFRTVARSATGAVLPSVPLQFAPCDAVGCTTASDGRFSARAPGLTTVRVTATGRNGVPVTAEARVRVEARPVLALAPAALTFDTEQGQPLPDAQTVAISNAGGGSLGTLSIESLPAGLSATFDRTQAPAVLTVRPTAALAPGATLTNVVRVRSSTPGVTPADLTVTITGRQPPPILVDRDAVPFTLVAGASAENASIAVTTTSGRTITGLQRSITYTPASAAGWLTATVAGSTPATLSLQANPAGLVAGTYVADVLLSAASPHQPRTVRVTMTVSEQTGRFVGRVLSALTEAPIPGTIVTVRTCIGTTVVPSSPALDSLVTEPNGTFTTRLLTRRPDLCLTYSASGFTSVTRAASLNAALTELPIELLLPIGTRGELTGVVRDATTNAAISGALVRVRFGAQPESVVSTATTDVTGRYVFNDLAPGAYLVRASREGYSESEVEATVSQTTQSAPPVFLVPTTTASWRIVLSWGANPEDLDAYLTGPNPSTGGRFQISYLETGSLTAPPFARLDNDVTNGFGPETITIAQQFAGVYRYSVNRFSGSGSIATSGARVDLYRGNILVRQFVPPAANGDWWNVFELSGETITTINTIGGTSPAPITVAPAGARQTKK